MSARALRGVRAIASATIVAASLLAVTQASAAKDLHVDGGAFKDARGAVVVLRGVNVAGNAKVPPFRPITRPELLDPLPRWGMNAVRLLFTWEAYEPVAGAYDETYLDYVASVVAAAKDRGLRVIVDFHQDAYARTAIGGCGEGFPSWAVTPDVTPKAPDNGASCSDWGARMVTDADLKTIWNAFYSDAHGARTRYLAMVERVAARFAAEPMVVGYDMMNEPGGDEASQIAPLYADASLAIRGADPDAILFVSPGALTSAGTQTALPKPAFAGAAYAPHFYDPLVLILKKWGGAPPAGAFDGMRAKAKEWDVPFLLGEFGAPASTQDGAAYVRSLFDALDATFASGTYWVYTPGWTDSAKDGWNQEDFSIVDGSGNLRATYAPRAYAPRVAGAPVSLAVHEDGAASSVDLTWDHDPAAGATDLFVPDELLAGSVIQVDTDGAGGPAPDCAVSARHVTCTAAASARMHVRIHAASPSNRCGLFGIEAVLPVGIAALYRRARARARRRPRSRA
jgi:endoglycosylceramidase